MHSCRTPFCVALLGSALALTALTPAIGANRTDHEKRLLAVHGLHPAALRLKNTAPVRRDATYTVVHDFTGAPTDGSGSGATLRLDDAGNIYGTTDFGGSANFGALFKIAPDGTETLLHSFGTGTDGSEPDGGVTINQTTGDLYGTAGSGGASGNGVIWKLAANGTYSVLHDFSTNDGSFIRGRMIRDTLGNFYGTALFGGINGDGTVFKYSFDGVFSVLHTFNGTDGEFPEHGVIRDRVGNLYGVTAFGGASDNGTVYKIAPDGTFTTLYSFTGGTDGGFLYGGLDRDNGDNLYGSTVDGGANGFGTVFKLAQDGTLTTLYSFTGGTDGASPEGDMLQVGGKHLYSTADGGGDPTCQCGGVYEVSTSGKEHMLHAFTGSDGSGYSAGLVKDKHLFYGTTASGGANSDGVVFSVTSK
ncbi:MAG TPA: choice-of-anchor tandem repeat GloVer-containing protein [Rhizomicrobium sp.]|jgi:uncharacterized repeat protein (TIGR03803 family)|nr:choice-of-anchor tandem repeat GloVer-containing protein [Rhizomicrobium sp.]